MNVQIAPDVLRHMRFRVSGTFTSKKSASYLGRLGSNSLLPVTPLMLMHHGFYGAEKLRRASLVLISPLVPPPFRIPVVTWVEASSPCAPCDWEVGVAIVSRIRDEFGVTHSGFFVNSSLAPVLRFRRRFVFVCNVLEGIKLHGFSETRVNCFMASLAGCCSYGPYWPCHLV